MRDRRFLTAASWALIVCGVAILLLMAGCAGPGPEVRRAVVQLGAVEAERGRNAAQVRKHLGAAWLELARHEHRAALVEAAEGGLEVAEAMAALQRTLAHLDRAREVLDGFAQVDAELQAQGKQLRDAVSSALQELEERSAAADMLAGASVEAAGALGEYQASRQREREAQAEANRLAEERRAREAEEEGER